jgi:hypothetical protein
MTVIRFPSNDFRSGGNGDGPEGPMLDQRVTRLETDVSEIKISMRSVQDSLIRIETELKALPKSAEIGEIKGRIAMLPTTLQLVTLVISTWAAGAGIALALMRFGKP